MAWHRSCRDMCQFVTFFTTFWLYLYKSLRNLSQEPNVVSPGNIRNFEWIQDTKVNKNLNKLALPWLNGIILFYRYMFFHCGDNTVIRSSYRHNENLLKYLGPWLLKTRCEMDATQSTQQWRNFHGTCVAPVNVVNYHECINGKKLIHLW